MAIFRFIFVLLLCYPVVILWLGLNVRHRERLPIKGPAIVCANHNSHLDIGVLFSLFPFWVVPKIRAAAAADYFLSNRLLAWFVTQFVGIIPVRRGAAKEGVDPLQGCYDALARGEIIVLFPEGTRGEPEQMQELKSGIWYLARRFPEAPIVPVFAYGLGKSLPRGSYLPLPWFVDVFIGRSVPFHEDKDIFMANLKDQFARLSARVLQDRPGQPGD